MEKLCWYISFFHTEKIIIMGILIINPLLLPSLPLMELFIFNKILMSSVFLNRKQLFLNVALSTKFVSLSMWIKMWELDKMRRKTFFAFFFIKRKKNLNTNSLFIFIHNYILLFSCLSSPFSWGQRECGQDIRTR